MAITGTEEETGAEIAAASGKSPSSSRLKKKKKDSQKSRDFYVKWSLQGSQGVY